MGMLQKLLDAVLGLFGRKSSGDFQSLVILLKSHQPLSEMQLRVICEKTFGQPFGNEPDDGDFVKQIMPGMIGVGFHGLKLGFIQQKQRYIPEDVELDQFDHRLRGPVADHTAWMAVDLADDTTNARKSEAYDIAGKILSALSDDRCVAVYATETGQLMWWHDQSAEMLRSGEPLEALRLIDPIVFAEGDDVELQAATDEAQRRWPEFLEALRNRAAREAYAVKAAFRDGEEVEHMWVQVQSADENSIVGILDNDPQIVGNVKYQQPVKLPVSDMEDWVYTQQKQMHGGFSIEVLSKRERGGK